ncbi:MAG: hypothetical protein AAFQ51_18625 [Pseudomonadota bacterium]
MSELDGLEGRIGTALSRIRAALAKVGDGGAGDVQAVRRLERVNAALRGQLKDMERKREADVAQLDALITELRPLVEEGADG